MMLARRETGLKALNCIRTWTLIFVGNCLIILLAIGIGGWFINWALDQIAVLKNIWLWLYAQNVFVFSAGCALLLIMTFLLGIFPLTQLWIFRYRKSRTIKLPEGDLNKYVNGFVTSSYDIDGEPYVDAMMVAGGLTPATEIPENKIQQTDKTILEIFGSYLAPFLSWRNNWHKKRASGPLQK